MDDRALPQIANVYDIITRSTCQGTSGYIEENSLVVPQSKSAPQNIAASFLDPSRPPSRVDRFPRRDGQTRRAKTPDFGKERLPDVRPRESISASGVRATSFTPPPGAVRSSFNPEKKPSTPSGLFMKERDRGQSDPFENLGQNGGSLLEAMESEFPNFFDKQWRDELESDPKIKNRSFNAPQAGYILKSANPLEELRKLTKEAIPQGTKESSPETSPRSSVLPTKIPKPFQIYEKSPLPPTDPNLNYEYEAVAKLWKITIFPSNAPTTRQDVLMLEKWMDAMLERVIIKSDDITVVARETHLLYTICLHEIVRQVSIHCIERGQLIGKIWNRYCLLFEMYLNHGGDAHRQLRKDRDYYKSELESYSQRVLHLERELAAKESEIKRVLEAQEIVKVQLEDLQETFHYELTKKKLNDYYGAYDSLSDSGTEDIEAEAMNLGSRLSSIHRSMSKLAEEPTHDTNPAPPPEPHASISLDVPQTKIQHESPRESSVDPLWLPFNPKALRIDVNHQSETNMTPSIMVSSPAGQHFGSPLSSRSKKTDLSDRHGSDHSFAQTQNVIPKIMRESADFDQLGVASDVNYSMQKSPRNGQAGGIVRSRSSFGMDAPESSRMGNLSARQKADQMSSVSASPIKVDLFGETRVAPLDLKSNKIEANDPSKDMSHRSARALSGRLTHVMTPEELAVYSASHKADETRKRLEAEKQMIRSRSVSRVNEQAAQIIEAQKIASTLTAQLQSLNISESELMEFLQSKISQGNGASDSAENSNTLRIKTTSSDGESSLYKRRSSKSKASTPKAKDGESLSQFRRLSNIITNTKRLSIANPPTPKSPHGKPVSQKLQNLQRTDSFGPRGSGPNSPVVGKHSDQLSAKEQSTRRPYLRNSVIKQQDALDSPIGYSSHDSDSETVSTMISLKNKDRNKDVSPSLNSGRRPRAISSPTPDLLNVRRQRESRVAPDIEKPGSGGQQAGQQVRQPRKNVQRSSMLKQSNDQDNQISSADQGTGSDDVQSSSESSDDDDDAPRGRVVDLLSITKRLAKGQADRDLDSPHEVDTDRRKRSYVGQVPDKPRVSSLEISRAVTVDQSLEKSDQEQYSQEEQESYDEQSSFDPVDILDQLKVSHGTLASTGTRDYSNDPSRRPSRISAAGESELGCQSREVQTNEINVCHIAVQAGNPAGEEVLLMYRMEKEQKQLENEILKLRKELHRVTQQYAELCEKTGKIAGRAKQGLVRSGSNLDTIVESGTPLKRNELMSSTASFDDLESTENKDSILIQLATSASERAYVNSKLRLPPNIAAILERLILTESQMIYGNRTRIKPIQYVLKRIVSILTEKISAPKELLYESMGVFCYQYYLARYGLRSITERHMMDFFTNVRQHRNSNNRAYRFGQFCGLYDPLPESCYEFYISCYRFFFEFHRKWVDLPNGTVFLPLHLALKAAAAVFPSKSSEQLADMNTVIEGISTTNPKRMKERVVDMDLTLEIMMQEHLGIGLVGGSKNIPKLAEFAERSKKHVDSDVPVAVVEAPIPERRRSVSSRRNSLLAEDDVSKRSTQSGALISIHEV
eukprot:TRINITY_DN6924_c0_g1_i1.p1 TRINITY_DN6924_c0_g1~~TRINITY_DN6924_c0_g1_i1.p1  ORF type:complete len:1556 (+),score=266.96 TRINITY_DN6924_c0_g1_i1:59-4726(+)